MVILHFWVKNVFFTKNDIISKNYRSLAETIAMGTENILSKFELDWIIFLDFTGI